MKKEKQNEFALAELGDAMLGEKLKLEKELSIVNRRVKSLEKMIKAKNYGDDELNVLFFKFLAQKRGYEIMIRLKEIEKELK